MSKTLAALKDSVASIGPKTTCDQAPAGVKPSCDACLLEVTQQQKIDCVAKIVYCHLNPNDETTCSSN